MPDLKTELWAAVSEAFPNGEVTVKVLDSGHSKLESRKLDPQYHVRVSGLTADTYELRTILVKEDGKEIPHVDRKPVKVPYAVAGMYPQDGDVQGISAFVKGLKSDSVRIVDSFPK